MTPPRLLEENRQTTTTTTKSCCNAARNVTRTNTKRTPNNWHHFEKDNAVSIQMMKQQSQQQSLLLSSSYYGTPTKERVVPTTTTTTTLRNILQSVYTTCRLLWDVGRLMCFVLALAPGFVRFAYFYLVSSHRTVVRYGTTSCRQTLDVYTTTTTQRTTSSSLPLRPVVIFYTGGAWCIGYKMWGALLARALTIASSSASSSSVATANETNNNNNNNDNGIVVVIPDTRNVSFGRGSRNNSIDVNVGIPDMVSDVDASLQWTFDNIEQYGGDSSKIVVVGQSAGGHLACTLLLRKALQRIITQQQEQRFERQEVDNDDNDDDNKNDDDGNSTSSTSTSSSSTSTSSSSSSTSSSSSFVVPTKTNNDICGFIGLSVPYDWTAVQSTFESHGLDYDYVVNHILFPTKREEERRRDETTTDTASTGSAVDVNEYMPLPLLQSCIRHQQSNNQRTDGDNKQRKAELSLLLPPFLILHGTRDKTVPHYGSVQFYRQLQRLLQPELPQRQDVETVGNNDDDGDDHHHDPTDDNGTTVPNSRDVDKNDDDDKTTINATNDLTATATNDAAAVTFRSYDGWSHTDAILEMPMLANHTFHKDVFDAVQQWTATTATTRNKNGKNNNNNNDSDNNNHADDDEQQEGGDKVLPPAVAIWPQDHALLSKSWCPKWLVGLGQWCNPF